MVNTHKSGFVNVIGAPNVGKSTLMNQLVGEKLSIITPKAQTTRHRILGIVNDDNYQIIYSDTPGLVDPAYKLHQTMMSFALSALEDADVLLVMVEMGEKKFKDPHVQEKIMKMDIPVIILVNKVDTGNQETLENQVEFWAEQFPGKPILPISALEGFNIDVIQKKVVELLPEAPPFYPKDGSYTDKTERFLASEIVREAILNNYDKEIPYASEVVVEEFKEEPHIIRIRGDIFVERNTQKGILIGHRGSALKRTGTEARKKMEHVFDKKVYLELHVKVDKNWRNDERNLRKYGYMS